MPSSLASSFVAAAFMVNGAIAAPTELRRTQPWVHSVPEAHDYLVSLGPRPYYIIQNMTDGPLKEKLESCENKPVEIRDWSIGHRGATLQFPEETVQSTLGGARMGAGILECDVAFTSDLQLVCRHSLCDLHTTTDILLKPELAAKCTTPFTPSNGTSSASALCCTSDITLQEYLSLCGKQDGANTSATTVEDYQNGAPSWRTTLYDQCGTMETLDSYIDLVDSLPGRRGFTPELKTPPSDVPMPFNGYTQQQYARDMIQAFIRHGIDPSRVWPQSFLPDDVYLWIAEFPEFGKQAVYLDEDGEDAPGPDYQAAVARLSELKTKGVNIIAPPIPYLLTYGDANNSTIVPSSYAIEAKAAGLDIIAWSFERSPPPSTVPEGVQNYYYFTVQDWFKYDGQLFEVLDVLAHDIGIKGLFSDWPASTTYFANCFELDGPFGSDHSYRK